ncbi:PREDICTED: peroxisome biogenesis factor 1 isoform X2 [Nanorana parkeri]|uniref:peroxisome biogenesis factor 1 isoform X2 n=1 Tax=Nanorana parkeri TaxID=125878 RepID=UPI000854EC80|nr:PREDICTED: peroxisome biogenesis factor 1 isoform X2 [Nanorana parkeri]
MLGGGLAGAAVTLTLTSAKDTFLRLTPELRAHLRLEQGHAVEVSWGDQPVYLGWMESRSRTNSGAVELNRQLGEKLGLVDGQQVFLKQCCNVTSCKEVTVEPMTADDWEILELHASALETSLLDQIRIVYPKAVFPVWVDLYTCVYIQIGTLTPAASYGRLEPLTELIVSPKSRDSEDLSSHLSQLRTDGSSKRPKMMPQESAPCGSTSNEDSSASDGENEAAVIQNPDGLPYVSSLWGALGNLFSRALGREPLLDSGGTDENLFERTVLKKIELDGVFRVSRHVPDNIRSSTAFMQHSNDNTVQVFLWFPEPSGVTTDVVVSYGRMVEVPSPKRRKKQPKSNAERSAGKTEQEEVPARWPEEVVKIVWHGLEDIKDVIEYDTRNGNTHTAKVWVPERIRKNLNINTSSAVRIQSLESQPKVPSSLNLRPKQPLEKNATENIRSALKSWLQSSGSSSWISGRTGNVQLSVNEDVAEFSYCLDDSIEEASQDQVYILYPTRLQKTKIHVDMDFKPSEDPPKTPQVDQNLPYLKMNNLGGVEDVLVSCYDHIVHCVMGSPLSRYLVSTSSGLRSGAILLSGPKGCGKSTIARALCKEAFESLEAHVEEIDCKVLKGKTLESICQTVEEAFAEAAWRQPAVVILDDLDQIAGVPATPELEHSPESAQSKQFSYVLKDLMKEIMTLDTQIAVIATSQTERSLNPVLVSTQGVHLFQCLKTVSPPAQKERFEMMRSIIENRLSCDITRFQDLDLHYIAKETEGFAAKDFTMVVERAVEFSFATRKIHNKQDLLLTTSDFQKALKGFTPLSLKNANLHKAKEQGWTMVGGLHDIRQTLMDTIELPAKYPEVFAALPIRHRSGILLYGAPGTGKTLLAGVVAHESGMNFISIKGPELLSKYIGASEQAVRDVFTRAQAAKPCILFFDEFDSIAPRRGHDNTGVTDRVVNQMLTQLDGVEGLHGVYVLAATSRPDLIDPALLRPGRLDECLYCPPPDQASRYEILKCLSQSMLLDDDVDLQHMASVTENFTGADLKALLYNAQLEAIHASFGPSTLVQDSSSGSDSDASLSSMIFLNQSSVSDESGGEADSVLDHSLTSLEMIRIPPEEPKSNIWRLYFGSSNESDLGNGSSDKQETSHRHVESKKRLCINQQHLMTSLASTRPSISIEDRMFFNHIYENFQNPKKSAGQLSSGSKKVTLA